ncbi:MAG: response regulator [Paracoccaceae bacterium]|nr:response regulator [Paracoccaceae bacterium]
MSADVRVALLQSVLQGDSSLVCVLDSAGGVVALSAAARAILAVLEGADQRAALQAALRRARQDGQADLSGVGLSGKITSLATGPGEAPLFLLRAEAPRDPPGDADAELQGVLQKLLVHDLRSLLQSVSAALEQLLEAEEGAPDAAALRGGAKSAISASLHQISRVLSVITGPIGTWLMPVQTDLDEILSEVVTQIGPIAARRGSALRLQPSGRGTVLSGPAVLLRELAQNMIDNAVKYGAGPVEVRVLQRLVAPGRWAVALEVWQAGQGVTREVLGQLRDGAPSAADDARPTYGLRIMRLALQWLGGRWERDVTATQSCLRACFTLPEYAVQQAMPVAAPDAPAASADLAGMTALVVEDQAINRDWAVRALRKAGAQVIAAEDAETALTLLRAAPTRVDLALVDITLPGIDGIALARRMALLNARQRPGAVIGLTGHGDPQTRAACRAAGMIEVLEKPILARDLLRYLAALWGKQEQQMPHSKPEARADQAPGALFDADLVAELTEDLGAAGARDFMLKAVAEAEATLGVVRAKGYGPETRPLLHSAVGSSGITGLKRIEIALRDVQAAAGDSVRHARAQEALTHAIAETREALK